MNVSRSNTDKQMAGEVPVLRVLAMHQLCVSSVSGVCLATCDRLHAPGEGSVSPPYFGTPAARTIGAVNICRLTFIEITKRPDQVSAAVPLIFLQLRNMKSVVGIALMQHVGGEQE